MPETKKEMENFAKLLEFEWDQFNGKDDDDEFEDEIKLKVPKEIHQLWLQWLVRTKELLGYDNASKAFEFAIVEAMNIPDASLITAAAEKK